MLMHIRSIFLITIVACSVLFMSIPTGSMAAPILTESFDTGIPASWTQIQYSGDGWWEWASSVYYEPPNTDGYFATADSDSNSSLVYDVGLFTPAMDMSGLTSVSIYVDRNFQDFAGYGEAHIATYSGSTSASDLEETLWYSTADDPVGGVEFSTTFVPSTYDDPSHVYVEFWYSTEGGTYKWSFSIDNVMIGPNDPPTAAFSYVLQHARSEPTATFDAYASTDDYGAIKSYSWDWDNDGIFDTVTTSASTTHVFDSYGSHTVTLEVTDCFGATDTLTKTIHINAPVNPIAAFMPLKNSNLARTTALYTDIQGQLPEEVPSDVAALLEEVEHHITNATGTSNAIFANNELRLAMEVMEEILAQL